MTEVALTALDGPQDAARKVLDQFVQRRPKFHLDGSSDWSLSADAIRFIAKNLPPNSVTLETGAGLSTALFAANGGQHFCVCPDERESARISAFCEENGIKTDGVEFIAALSEDVLPQLVTRPLDLVLIDGGHGFPMPMIDWYYTAKKLKVGGLMVIDDIPLWSCRVLVDFLKRDPAWTSMGSIGRYSHAFRLIAPFQYQEFCFQPVVVRKSRMGLASAKLLTAFDLILAGEFSEFLRRLRRRS